MNLQGKLVLTGGFVFDYNNMLGANRIKAVDVEKLEEKLARAKSGLEGIRSKGLAKAHCSKDGQPEPVYFTRLPFIKKENPNTPDSIAALKNFGAQVRNNTDVIVFLGVGGSYLGNKVIFDVAGGETWNTMDESQREGYPRVYFSGNNLDGHQYKEILAKLRCYAAQKKNGSLNVMLVPISKSGTTLETLTAFMYFYEVCSQCSEIKLEVTVVTDLQAELKKSPLHSLAIENGWQCFDIKEGVGGRFCVLSDPGLITAVAMGFDIEEFLAGAREMEEACQTDDLSHNPALLNAALKYIAAETYGCDNEVFMGYGARLKSLGEWYVQLLAESLGKRKDRNGATVYYGRTPIAAVGSTDMHAQTQQHQDGKYNKVVQFVEISEEPSEVILGDPFAHIPDFNKYAGLDVDQALKIALSANAQALDDDGRFNAKYILPQLNAFYLGQLLYFLMLSVAYEGELADVDAYDQPGVEAYKKIMKEQLGRI